MPRIPLTNVIEEGLLPTFTNAGVPTDGSSGTLAGEAPFGALLMDTSNGVLYINTGTKASPSWEPLASGGSVAGVIEVRNETGGTINAGSPVYVSGWSESQDKFLISKADADASGAIAQFITLESISNNANGRAGTSYRGTVNGTGDAALDLAGATVGDPIYLSTTAGQCTLTAPTGGNAVVQILGRVAIVATDVAECRVMEPNRIGTNQLPTNTFTGAQVGNVASGNVIGGIPVVHILTIPDSASGDTDIVLTHKTLVLAAAVRLTATGDVGNTYQLKNGSNAISTALSPGATDNTFAWFTRIDEQFQTIAAGGTLRVSHVRNGGSSAATVMVIGVREA
jgi:hypothetical protein